MVRSTSSWCMMSKLYISFNYKLASHLYDLSWTPEFLKHVWQSEELVYKKFSDWLKNDSALHCSDWNVYYAWISFLICSFICQVAIPDLLEATTGADILVFVLPHQYVKKICSTLKGNIKSNAVAVSLIKVGTYNRGTLKLIQM